MLTARGRVVAAAAVSLALTGRVLGIYELFLLAAGIGALVVGSVVAVRIGRVRLRAFRQLHPPRVHCGSDSRVELVLANEGRRTTPVLTVRDPFDHGRRQARFLVPSLRPAEMGRAAY